MGKLSAIFRRASSASQSVLLGPTPYSSAALQRKIPSPAPHYLTQKNSYSSAKNNDHTSKPIVPLIIITSPELSIAKSCFKFAMANRCNNTLDSQSFCNLILKAYCKVSSVQDSILFLNHMVESYPLFSPNQLSHDTILVQSCSSRAEESLSNVHKVFDLMSDSGFVLSQALMDVLVKSLCECGREEHAIELVKELSAKNTPPDTCTYNFLLRHLITEKSDVNVFVKDMREFGLKPDLVTYAIMINSSCNINDLKEAMRLLEVTIEEGHRPDRGVYNTIMKCCCMSRTGKTLLKVYKIMHEQGVELDRYTFNTLIFGLSKSRKIKEAMMYSEMMTEMGHLPDIFTYNYLMNGMCREGDALGALEVYKKMQDQGIKSDRSTFNTLIYGLSKSGRVKEAIDYVSVMDKMGHKPDEDTCCSLVRGMCDGGHALGSMLGLLEKMKGKGYTPRAYAYNALLSGLCKARLLEKAVELYELMKKRDVKLEVASFGSFLRQLNRKGKVDEAKKAFDYAIANKTLTDVIVYSTFERTIKGMRGNRNFKTDGDHR